MLDVAGLRVTSEEKEILRHSSVGGVILFARNFQSPRQLLALTAEIRALRRPELLIAVDHEGGRVQRFEEGFTRIPPMPSSASAEAMRPGPGSRKRPVMSWRWSRTHGVDFICARARRGLRLAASSEIVSRAAAIAALAGALSRITRAAASVGAFPGHGYVKADPTSMFRGRARAAEIEANDSQPTAI
jgi:beta-N-acetylhexosaminidase